LWVDRVVLNAIVGEARRKRIVFTILFAAFFSPKTLRHVKPGASVLGVRLSSHNQALKARGNVPGSPIPATA